MSLTSTVPAKFLKHFTSPIIVFHIQQTSAAQLQHLWLTFSDHFLHLSGKQVEYLVKFDGLGYDECYWEWAEDIAQFQDAVKEYNQQLTILEEAQERLDSHQQAGSKSGLKRRRGRPKKGLNEDGKLEVRCLL